MVITDIVEGAQLDHGVYGSTLKRIAFVDDLDNNIAADPSVFFRALAAAGLPQWYDPHPSNPNYTLNRHVVNPADDSSCTIDLYYVTGPASPAAATWLVTESTTLMSADTQIDPASGTNITVLGDKNNNIRPKVATISGDISLLRLTFEGWIAKSQIPGGTTPTQVNTAQYNRLVNSVNAAPWRGYDVGYWRFAEWDDSTQDRGFSFTIRAGFITKITEDWSQYAALRDPNNGGNVMAPDQNDLKTLRATTYKYGMTQKPCITKIGRYPTADFAGMFGT